ncbi:MAG: alpha-ribazole phosphatase, partial [Gammaproteobacteria bacterium]
TLTAQAIADTHGLDINHDARLMEFDLGDWEGASFESLNGADRILEQLVNKPNFTAPNGESQQSVKERIVAAIEDIVKKHSEKNIVIVAHGVTFAIALSHYLHGDTTRWPQYSKDNTGFSEICLNSMALLSYNKTEHLKTDDS